MSQSTAAVSAMFSAPWTILTADCMDVMRDLPDASVDHVIADPPYDEKTHRCLREALNSGQASPYARASRPNTIAVEFEELTDVSGIVAEQLRVCRRWVVDFCTMEMIADYKSAAGEAWVRSGFWYAPVRSPQFSGDRPAQAGDAVAIMHRAGRKRWNGGGHKAFWLCPVEHTDRVHGTQKPLPLLLRMVEQFTDPGDLVLDTHCGSGTTGVACLRLGRRFVGIERDAAMAETARERLRAEERGLGILAARAGQQGLFQ